MEYYDYMMTEQQQTEMNDAQRNFDNYFIGCIVGFLNMNNIGEFVHNPTEETVSDNVEGDYLTYHPKETNFPHIKEVIDRINWLPLNGGIELKNQRLTDIDLVKGDGHFTEEGNENIANYLFNGIKKYEKTLKENS